MGYLALGLISFGSKMMSWRNYARSLNTAPVHTPPHWRAQNHLTAGYISMRGRTGIASILLALCGWRMPPRWRRSRGIALSPQPTRLVVTIIFVYAKYRIAPLPILLRRYPLPAL